VHRVVERIGETNDITTLVLEPLDAPSMTFRCGQFNMLSAFGVGEIAISMSSAPGEGTLRHSIRDVGAVSHALCQSRVGDLVGVRGPFGSDWLVESASVEADLDPRDTIVVAGGIGLAPLRGAVEELVRANETWRRPRLRARRRARAFPNRLQGGPRLVEGPRCQGFADRRPRDTGVGRPGRAGHDTAGRRGFLTLPIRRAMLCGPEVMMRFTARALVDLGMDPEGILVRSNAICNVASAGVVTANWDRSSFVVTVRSFPTPDWCRNYSRSVNDERRHCPIPRPLGGVEVRLVRGASGACSTAKTSS